MNDLTDKVIITREQVEKEYVVRTWETVADEGFVDTMGRQVFHLHCPVCDFFWRETGHKKYFRFCPHCGAPMTAEAVDILWKRKRREKTLFPPCKIGDTVYILHYGKYPHLNSATVSGIHLRDETYRGGKKRREYVVVRKNGFSKHRHDGGLVYNTWR